MLVVGAKGLAKEILQILEDKNLLSNLVFFDDVNFNEESELYGSYPILRTDEEVLHYFKTDCRFVLGLGNPKLRKKLCARFESLGGQLITVTDNSISIGNYIKTHKGHTLMAGVKISNGVKLGKGVLVYYNVIITHDVNIGNFVELSPGCILLGHVVLEDEVQVGAGAIILPKVKIGKRAVIGAGAVVTKDVHSDAVMVGNPAKVIKLVSDEMIAWKSAGTKLYQQLPSDCHKTLKEVEPLREIPENSPKQEDFYQTLQEMKKQ